MGFWQGKPNAERGEKEKKGEPPEPVLENGEQAGEKKKDAA